MPLEMSSIRRAGAPCMPAWGHIPLRRPPGPGPRRLPILQTQALKSAFGRDHVSVGSSGLKCPVGLTLTLGCFLGLPSPVAWPGSLAIWGLLIHNVGFWVPPTWKPCPLAPCRILLAAPTYIPPLRTHTTPEDNHTKIPQPDRPPNQRPQLGPPRSLPGQRHFRPAPLPGPNPNPRWCVPDPDPRGLPPNSSRAWRPPTAGRTQPLSQEPTLASGAVYRPRSGGKLHAPLRPFPLSWPLQAPNPGPEEPPESRPQLRPGVRP